MKNYSWNSWNWKGIFNINVKQLINQLVILFLNNPFLVKWWKLSELPGKVFQHISMTNLFDFHLFSPHQTNTHFLSPFPGKPFTGACFCQKFLTISSRKRWKQCICNTMQHNFMKINVFYHVPPERYKNRSQTSEVVASSS